MEPLLKKDEDVKKDLVDRLKRSLNKDLVDRLKKYDDDNEGMDITTWCNLTSLGFVYPLKGSFGQSKGRAMAIMALCTQCMILVFLAILASYESELGDVQAGRRWVMATFFWFIVFFFFWTVWMAKTTLSIACVKEVDVSLLV